LKKCYQTGKEKNPLPSAYQLQRKYHPLLDALENINRKTPLDGLRWSIEHAEQYPENIAREKNSVAVLPWMGKMALHGDGVYKTSCLEKSIADPRLKLLVESGIPLAMTTDAFMLSYNP